MYFFEKQSVFIPIQGCLDSDGKVVVRPSKKSRQLLILQYLAEKLPVGFVGSEMDINLFLNNRHTFNDVALLRRELYIAHYIDRTLDGKKYWKEDSISRQ